MLRLIRFIPQLFRNRKALMKKAQGLPMQTIIIIILVIIVLAAVGYVFFQNYLAGSEGFGRGTEVTGERLTDFEEASSRTT